MEGFVEELLLPAACLVVGMLLGVGAAEGARDDSRQIQAIDRGYALYCPNNGEWAWIGECEGGE